LKTVGVGSWQAPGIEGAETASGVGAALTGRLIGLSALVSLQEANPCRIRGAGNTKRVEQIRPATLAELTTIVESVPARYWLMVLLASWCALRFGELA
jgi:hypothetical protein